MFTQLAIFGPIGSQELVLIFILILLLFGAKKLPEFARGLGKSLGEFRRAKEEFEDEITRSQQQVDVAIKDSERKTKVS
jgi:TatA/E family protein of Tat protein translocase